MATLPYQSQNAGIPGQWTETFTDASADALVVGHEPALLVTDQHVFAPSQTIPALTPVGLDANSRLVPALWHASTPIKAIGITVTDVTTDASSNYRAAPIYRGGCFNTARLNWPASFDTADKRAGAFEGSPSPTRIITRTVKTGAV